jgi:exodeoxyribonuclease V alpha subunit
LIEAFWSEVERLTEAGELRRLSGVFARFVASLGAGDIPLLLAATVLSELEGRGHSCLMLADLAGDPATLLGWPEDEWKALARAAIKPLPKNVKGWTAQLAGCEQVWRVGDLDYGQPLVLRRRTPVPAPLLARRDRGRLQRARARAGTPRGRSAFGAHLARPPVRVPRAAAREDKPDWQKLACAIALRGSVAIITGGPGTGKTYTVARLLALLFATAPDAARQRIALAAPTGKAAARLKQSIDKALGELAERVGEALPLRELTARMGAARTLHSLLGARPDSRAFRPPPRQSARRRRPDRRRSLDGAPGDDGGAARRAAAPAPP